MTDAVLDDAVVKRLLHHWDAGWNGEDIDVIMEPFADDIVFSSSFVGRVGGDAAQNSIVGKPALRAYCQRALARTPGIRYTIHEVFLGPDTVVLTYRCDLPDGRVKEGADTMKLNVAGEIVHWQSHYRSDSLG